MSKCDMAVTQTGTAQGYTRT